MELITKILIFVVVSAFISYLLYYITPESNESKNDTTNVIIRNVLPGITFGLFVMVLIKNKEDKLIDTDEIMTGSYFGES